MRGGNVGRLESKRSIIHLKAFSLPTSDLTTAKDSGFDCSLLRFVMVGVQDVLDKSGRILLQRVKPAWCTKFLLQVLCKLELFSGAGGSFTRKKKNFGFKKEKV
jgi:hypothetical protein